MMEENEGSLQLSDWIIIGIMLGASAAVGVYYRFTGGKQKTSEVLTYVIKKCLIRNRFPCQYIMYIICQ